MGVGYQGPAKAGLFCKGKWAGSWGWP